MISYKYILRYWDSFFFKSKPTEGIALFRIIWMSIIFMTFIFDISNMVDFYGPHALISIKTVKEQFMVPHMNIFHSIGVDYTTLKLFLLVYGLSIFAALIGFQTRKALILVTICMVSLHQRNIWLLSSAECLMRIVTILLVCSPCGQSLSFDAWWAKRKGLPWTTQWSPWALRLIQIQVSVVYLWTAWHKLKGDTWLEGTAVYYATRIEMMINFPAPFLLDNILFLKLSTWGTLILEISLGTLIWIKELRKPLIIAGILFHLGIEYTMSLPFFEVIMVALLINYYSPEELKSFVDQIRDSAKQRIAWIKTAKTISWKPFSKA